MRIYHKSESQHTRATLARMVSGFLLAGIVFSATFGALHSHGNVVIETGASIYGGSVERAHALFAPPLWNHSDEHECLICVLHRQFSGSIVHEPFSISGPSAQASHNAVTPVYYRADKFFSTSIDRPSGRAPPLRRA